MRAWFLILVTALLMTLAEAGISLLRQNNYEKDLFNFSFVVESFGFLHCLMEVSLEDSTGQCAREMLDVVVRLLFH